MTNIRRELDNLSLVITTYAVTVKDEMAAYRALRDFALEHDRLTISQMMFDEYWDEGLEYLEQKEAEAINLINDTLNKFRADIHSKFQTIVKDCFAESFVVDTVENFLLKSVIDTEADELSYDFGCLGYDEEFLNKVLSEYEEDIEALEELNKFADEIIEEQQQIKQFEADAYEAGFDVVEYNSRIIESDNRLNILYSNILAVAEGIDQVAMLIRVDTPGKFRRVVINTNNAFVKNTFSLKAPFREKVKRSRHQMDLQIKNKQGFEIGLLACMVHDIIDGIMRPTYDGLFVSHKFDQGNRDTSYEPDNVSRVGVELLPTSGGINGQINAVHKFLNDDKNLYILEGKDHKLIEQIIQLKNKDPQAAKDLACKLRRRTFISSDIKKNVWKF